jgi:hypothetical protein
VAALLRRHRARHVDRLDGRRRSSAACSSSCSIVGIAFFGGVWSESVDRLWEAHLLVDVGVAGLGSLDPILWFGVLNAGALLLALAVAQPLVPRFERAGRDAMARILLVLDAVLIAATLAFVLAGSFLLPSRRSGPSTWQGRSRTRWATWLNANVDDSRVRPPRGGPRVHSDRSRGDEASGGRPPGALCV